MDTWAATSAGAMTLSENALYTVDGWRVFYDHLKPGGVITFSRWSSGAETNRLFAVAKAMLLSEGVSHPETPPGRHHLGQYRDSARQQPALFGVGPSQGSTRS